MQHPRRVFSREEVLDAVWGPDIHVEPRTVDVHIRRLRKAINGSGELDVVRTVRAAGLCIGYRADLTRFHPDRHRRSRRTSRNTVMSGGKPQRIPSYLTVTSIGMVCGIGPSVRTEKWSVPTKPGAGR